jgi:hypothetical protein
MIDLYMGGKDITQDSARASIQKNKRADVPFKQQLRISWD